MPLRAPSAASARTVSSGLVLVVVSVASLLAFGLAAHLAPAAPRWVPWAIFILVLAPTFAGSLFARTPLGARLPRRAADGGSILAADGVGGEAVLVTDAHGVVRELNDEAARLLDRRVGAVIDRPCGGALGLRTQTGTLDCAGSCAIVARGDADTPIEVLSDRLDGSTRALLAEVTVVEAAGGTGTDVIHRFHDITALRETDEAKTVFLAVTAHELKTPLAVMRGAAELLEEGRVPEEQQNEVISMIRHRAEDLTALVQGLLLTTRIERGHLDLATAVVDVRPVVVDRVRSFRRSTHRRVELDIADVPAPVWTDPNALGTVIDHLLENALTYSPSDTTVWVRVETREQHLDVVVEDHGKGMDADQVERVFDRFWRAESSVREHSAGSGIGLYVVRSLVEAMDGTVTVTSAPGEGSQFAVTLRRHPPSQREVRRVERPAVDHGVTAELLAHSGVTAADGHPS